MKHNSWDLTWNKRSRRDGAGSQRVVLAGLLGLILGCVLFGFVRVAKAEHNSALTTALVAQGVSPVLTSTPNPDGSIVHIVQPGQSLIQIANAYQIPLTDLLTLNHISTGWVIYPGERLLIKAAGPTPTSTPPPTNTPRSTATLWPTHTPTIPPSPAPTSLPATPTPAPASPNLLQTARSRINQDPFLFMIIGLVLLSAILFLIGSAIKRGS